MMIEQVMKDASCENGTSADCDGRRPSMDPSTTSSQLSKECKKSLAKKYGSEILFKLNTCEKMKRRTGYIRKSNKTKFTRE